MGAGFALISGCSIFSHFWSNQNKSGSGWALNESVVKPLPKLASVHACNSRNVLKPHSRTLREMPFPDIVPINASSRTIHSLVSLLRTFMRTAVTVSLVNYGLGIKRRGRRGCVLTIVSESVTLTDHPDQILPVRFE